ncbi:MAG TPA: chemotaxis protein CheD, partial [Thermoanaerobaculia bacterium]|nr:chemotaxis protein CheD [Thermoanaerobaculia bacterium]
QLLGIGGMNHYMLPINFAVGGQRARFADTATAALIEKLLDIGASVGRLKAKVFGGASVLALAGSVLGERNVQAARLQLAERRIPIIVEDVGGTAGRKLTFRTDTGAALVRVVQ